MEKLTALLAHWEHVEPQGDPPAFSGQQKWS
jgi:hypothetical protein